MLKIAITAVFSALVTSIFWVWVYSQPNAAREPNGTLSAAGDVATVKPAGAPPVAIAEGLEVGPAGLAIPVVGVKPNQLTDTFTQARAGGAGGTTRSTSWRAEGTPVIAAAAGHGRETVLQQRRRREHRLRPLARPEVELIITPTFRPMRPGSPRASR